MVERRRRSPRRRRRGPPGVQGRPEDGRPVQALGTLAGEAGRHPRPERHKIGAEFKADDAVLFTLSECTEAALEFANANTISIRNAHEIAAAIDALGIERFPELLNPDSKLCPKCGAPMILRKTATPFWGCSTYPRCRGKIEA